MNTTNAPASIPDDLIDTAEAAKLLKTDRQCVVRWVLLGDIVGFKRKRRWFVSKASVLAMFVPPHPPGGPVIPDYCKPKPTGARTPR